MGKHLLLLVLVQVLDDIHSIIGIHVVDELGGNHLGRQFVQQALTVVLVHLDQNIGRRLVIQLTIYKTGVLNVKLITQLGDIGGVHLIKDGLELGGILVLNHFKYVIQKFLLHSSEYFGSEAEPGKRLVFLSLRYSGLALNHKRQADEILN